MKKLVLLGLVMGLGFMATSQTNLNLKQDLPEHKAIDKVMVGIEPAKASGVVINQEIDTPVLPPTKDVNVVSIINIGTSGNAYSYGYAGGQKSIVWAVPELNMVTNFHRMGGTLDPGGYSGDLGYDLSVDGGLNWENMIEMYIAENNAGGEYYTDAARYPHHGVWNPEGNTNIDNAWMSYFAPNLDGSNSTDSWGGYSYGAVNMGDPSIRTKNLQSTAAPYYQYIPDGFEITKNGRVFALDVNQDWSSGSVVYQGSLILNKGEWNEGEEDFIFDQELLDAPVAAATTRPSHTQIAFADDGQTGYISFLGDNETVDIISEAPGYYPIIMKTTDGGDTWSDPQGIQLGGPNGIAGIINDLLTDEQIAQLYEEPLPARDEIPYTSAFDHNISVDANGNLHIGVVIGVVGSDDYSIVSASHLFAAYDIYTTDGGTTWHGIKLGSINQFRGTWPGDYTEDNRIQTTLSPDRNTVFVSWLDTDLDDAEDNGRPNIFIRGVRPNAWGTADMTCTEGVDAPTNVTMFSEGMWSSSFFVAAQMSFYDGNAYTIPMTYQPVPPDVDPGVEVQYKYITNFSFTEADFCIVGTNEIAAAAQMEVSQNFPNPFNKETNVTVNLTQGSELNLSVYNITGQKVSERNYGYKPAGSQITMTISGDELPTGVYFYTVEAGSQKVTRKMIVQ
ncbi:MAG: T9SS type A sorting domain-containing protein [Bacteroidales bacterium]|nr:T9SS type A sorting domain-containing protein [Bacteroidales bacterium]